MNTDERQRIIKAGGFVSEGRVNGSLALSRALGDFDYKGNKELCEKEQAVTGADGDSRVSVAGRR